MASAEVLKSSEINTEFAQLLTTLPPMPDPLPPMTIENQRSNLAASVASCTAAVAPPGPDVLETDTTISARDGSSVPVRIYKPADLPSSETRPLVVVFHGGGFVSGVHDDMMARLFVRAHGVVCLDVYYRHAPECPFPTSVHDSYDGLKWAAANANSLGADPTKGFLTFGISAGGNLAISTAYMARDEGLTPPLTGVAAQIPATIIPGHPPAEYKDLYVAYEQNKDAPMFNKAALDFLLECYQPPLDAKLYSPFNYSDLGNMPPIYMQACGLDPLRDDALIFERALRDRAPDVEVRMKLYPGVPHGFFLAFPQWEFAKGYLADSVANIGDLLAKTAGRV